MRGSFLSLETWARPLKVLYLLGPGICFFSKAIASRIEHLEALSLTFPSTFGFIQPLYLFGAGIYFFWRWSWSIKFFFFSLGIIWPGFKDQSFIFEYF